MSSKPTQMIQVKTVLYVVTVVFLFLILIFGVYALPILPKSWVNTNDQEAIANQIAYINYLLTFLATMGTLGGIGFTVFGYYQTVKVPQYVAEEVNKRFEIDREKNKRMVQEKIQKKIQNIIEEINEEFKLIKEDANKKIEEMGKTIEKLNEIPSERDQRLESNEDFDKDLINANYNYKQFIGNRLERFVENVLLRRKEIPLHDQIDSLTWGIQQQLSLSAERAIQLFKKVMERDRSLAESIYEKVKWGDLTESERKQLSHLVLVEGNLTKE